ncbi:hypothetical protein XBKQ1_970031 [Xenorhabdus bovienii str. kraussei Quebec]|uniref:Uncharacterized protein n=1 Tax=Xenorhabdus bovienii str. kraussei Quebec TaxID=1398203 RepID=A0A077PCK7_XENBV|nr:hypothetical protein [Xenorhabdus bovienii]CDH22150.1 hypothetical protein XBKQ1_970031 [Xenorhabdus bovienii str. kraussei Quebec]
MSKINQSELFVVILKEIASQRSNTEMTGEQFHEITKAVNLICGAFEGKAIERQSELQLPTHTPCPTAPKYVWLQTDPEPEEEGKPIYPDNGVEITWCSGWINPTDTLYVRADLVQRIKGIE